LPLYDFPNVKVTKHFIPESPLRTSALRTLGAYANVFALESFMDELALAAKADPVEFRLRHMKDERARAVIEGVADRARWKSRQRDTSTGWGFAFAKYKNLACYCAIVTRVRIDRKTGQVRVLETFAVVDAGQTVNPDGLSNQIEGGIIQSTSWTLKEAVHYDGTRVTTRSWSDYPILRFDEVPQIDVTILDHPELPPLGVGEAAQGPTAAAIANAIAHATGKRLRSLPFTPAAVKSELG
jgi:CO/xanthine dehydrogenase Mo-binding subunit